ncbi:restriction endonuclease subunit S [Pseudoxanthomonas sp. PXM04]|uniref:restriction endonuclease subunit S n=1 Tax=Pseudoxanthomonas sp. PXM04 TaxID=2769297 RepID=UPI00177DA8CB|nr:restriction endonuclease subunit S [Pseudoxanthomonas sp. PXM04]MBD9378120.1 restriction endonuclease subunit S [Pseudoxanthomonas sp. PXM04]
MTIDQKITEVVDFNPPRVIKRGAVAPFVDMAALAGNQRDIAYVSEREFSGAGSRFQNGDTLFARITPCLENGKTAKVTSLPPGSIAHGSTEFIVMAAKAPEYDEDYVYYLARHPDFRAFAEARMEGTSGRQRVSWQALSDFSFSFPSPDQRKFIGSILRKIDDKIYLSRHINKNLEAMAQTIFKSWFVDFDPVKAKITAIEQGEDPLRAAMRAISGKIDAELDQMPREYHDQLAATAALFPDAMEESDLGDIPKGWTHGVLGDVCSFTAGSAFKPEHQGSTEGDYPFIKVSDMNLAGNDVFIQSANNYVSKAQQSEMKAKLHPIGATVFAKIGVALISNRRRLLTTPTIIDNNLMSASPVDGKSGAYFLYSMLSTIDFNTLVSGTALPYLNVSDLKKIPIVRPSHDVGCDFERKASSIFSMMQALTEQSSTLADTRDNLLPKLLSGEVELSESLEG